MCFFPLKLFNVLGITICLQWSVAFKMESTQYLAVRSDQSLLVAGFKGKLERQGNARIYSNRFKMFSEIFSSSAYPLWFKDLFKIILKIKSERRIFRNVYHFGSNLHFLWLNFLSPPSTIFHCFLRVKNYSGAQLSTRHEADNQIQISQRQIFQYTFKRGLH